MEVHAFLAKTHINYTYTAREARRKILGCLLIYFIEILVGTLQTFANLAEGLVGTLEKYRDLAGFGP